MENEFDINENFDSEIEMYKLLAKIKNAGLYSDLSPFVERVLGVFGKRFGYIDHVNETDEETIADELIDCVNHVVATDKRFTKLFDLIDNEYDQTILCGMIMGIILPGEVEK